MKHEMKLNNEPFINIKNGTKTIELRLNDEKRRLLKVNDLIEFTNRETNEKLTILKALQTVLKDALTLVGIHVYEQM